MFFWGSWGGRWAAGFPLTGGGGKPDEAPQASQARPAPHCVGRLFARAKPAREASPHRGGGREAGRRGSGVGGRLPVDGWWRKARRDPSGLARSASSPVRGAFFRGHSPREKPPLTGELAAKQAGGALDVSGGGGVKTPPYGAKDTWVVMVRLCEWVADERGKGGRQPAPSSWREVARERVVTQSPSKPLRPAYAASSPLRGAPFCAGGARAESLPCQREVPSASEAEGFLAVYGRNGQSGKARRNPPGR